MGEQADMMVDGTLCMGCGEILGGEPPGVPRYCEDCDSEARQQRKAARRQQAGSDFAVASTLAAQHGLAFVRKTDAHYHLYPHNRQWLLNVYPGNCRLYNDPNKQTQPPYLGIPTPWTLTEVVQVMVHELKKRSL